MIYKVTIKYRDTQDPAPIGTEITVRGATPAEVEERLEALADWLPDNMYLVTINCVSIY